MIKSRRLRWAGHVAKMKEGKSAFKILTGKPLGKRPLLLFISVKMKIGIKRGFSYQLTVKRSPESW